MPKRVLLGLVVVVASALLWGCSKQEAPAAAPGTPVAGGAGKGGVPGTAAPEPTRPDDAAQVQFGSKLGGR